jgi:hypothetical protein
MKKVAIPDIVDRLLDGADGIHEMRAELQALMREAALDIEALRGMDAVRESMQGEDHPRRQGSRRTAWPRATIAARFRMCYCRQMTEMTPAERVVHSWRALTACERMPEPPTRLIENVLDYIASEILVLKELACEEPLIAGWRALGDKMKAKAN